MKVKMKLLVRLMIAIGLLGASVATAQLRQAGVASPPMNVGERMQTHAPAHYFPELQSGQQLGLATSKTEAQALAQTQAVTTADGVTLYGLIKQGGSYKIVSTDVEPTTSLELKTNGITGYDYEGGVIKGGRFYVVCSVVGRLFMINSYDVHAWTYGGVAPNIPNPYIVALTCTPSDEVYGCFTNSSATAYDFGKIDMINGTRTVIGALPKRFPAIAAATDGTIYGVAVDGNLYRIDAATGAVTLIGATGQTVSTAKQSATFHADNGNMYWTAGNTIYRVNTQTGAATAVATIDGDAVSDWLSLFSIASDAGSTPTWISNLKIDFSRDALSGTIGFTLPMKDTSGNSLSGMLEYHVTVDGEDLLTGQAPPGSDVSRPMTVTEGAHRVVVYTVNNGTKGLESTTNRFFGHDEPCTPTNAKVTVTDSKDIVISWNSVVSGLNNGYINMDGIRYRVVRQPGNTVVAESSTACSVNDTSLDNMGYYTYEITATDGVKSSVPAVTNRMLLGEDKGVTPPYAYNFDDEGGFGLFTQNDANGDGYAWKYDAERKIVWYEVNPSADSDDWLISPGLNLEAGKNYNLKFDFIGSARMEPEYFEVYYGSSPDPKDLKKVIVNRFGFKVRVSVNTWFKPDESGVTYIGIRMVTPAVEGAIMIDNFSVSEGHVDGAPAAVSNAKVEPAPMGGMSATLSFVLPDKTFAGTPLTSITSVKVTNTTTGHTIPVASPAPGKSVQVTDNNPAEGTNDYTIICVNADGESLATNVSAWVGVDLPGLPRNVQWVQTGDKTIRLAWEAPTGGQHGGYIDFSTLKYYVVIPSNQQIVTNECTDTSLEMELEMASTQEVLSFGVAAINEKGIGVAQRSNESAYGTGLKCPFYESFEDAGLHSTPWMVKQPSGYNSCNVITDIYGIPIAPYDDNGMVAFSTLTTGSTRLELPLLDISDLKAPVLKMWVYFVGGGGRLVACGNNSSGLDWLDLKEIPNDGGEAGWHLVSVPLDRFRGEKRVQLGLEMFVDETPQYVYYILVDKLCVVDNPDYDLMMSYMTVPERVNAGESFISTVNITNAGAKRVDNYRINATVNGALVAVKECGPIEPDQVVSVDVSVPLSSNATSMDLIMAVDCDGDSDHNNDAWGARDVQVVRSRYPQPLRLVNNSTDNSLVSLDWSAPEARYQATVTDNIESYEHGTVGGIDVKYNQQTGKVEANVTEGKIGPYKVVDNDQQLTLSVQLMMNRLPHDRDGMACQVIDLDQLPGITGFSTIWAGHSGSSMLCFWQSRTYDDNYDIPNDDWLILPRLADDDPRISFWAKSLTSTYGLESFEIMISMDSDAIEDFESYQSVVNVPAGYVSSANAGYTFYEFELPEGTRYVAIRYNAAGTTALLIDDISYTPDDNYKDLDLIGYNVYRNGVKINTEPLKEPRFNDRPSESGDYLYNVTALFAEGESRYSNTVRVNGYTAGVSGVAADGALSVCVIGHEIEVNGAAGETVSLYSADGRLLDTRVAVSDTERFAATPGMYVVRAANVARIVIVK